MKNFLNYAKNRFLYNFIRLLIAFGLCLLASQFLFIPNVYADTYNYDQFTAQLYDNINGSLSERTTTKGDNYWTGQVGLTAYSSGAAWGFNSPTAIVNGHTYSLTVNFSTNNQSYSDIIFSSINRIGLGTSLSNAKLSYQNATNTNLVYSNNSNGTLQFVFDANTTGSYLVVPFATSYSINLESVYFNNFVISDLGSSSDVSQDTINNSLNSQTTEINNYINNSTNTITGSITQTEENINNNINEKFEICKAGGKNLYDYQNNTFNGPYYNSSGQIISSSFKSTINYINVKPNTSYTLSGLPVSSSNWFYVVYFDSSKNFISRTGFSLTNSTQTITTPARTSYILFEALPNVINSYLTGLQLEVGTSATSYESYKEVCTNRIDETNDKLDDLNSSINDESMPNTPDFSGLQMADDTPISDLILMPINYLNKLVNAFSGSCKTYVLDFGIFGSDYNLSLPCIKPEKWLGSDVWNIVDVFACFFMIYEIAMLAVSIFNDFTSMRDTYDSLYTPKHAKPLGKHTSEVE